MVVVVLQWLCGIILAISGIYGLYQVCISLHMFGSLHIPQPETDTYHRFAVLIFAKNEERVIGQLLSSLNRQNYKAECFDIFVTADNCTDQTAAVARAAGATVFERADPAHKSKGYALNWFFSRFLNEYEGCYDACVVFDADNVVDREFLAAMNRQLNIGHPIATGYRMGKNPSSSWISGCSTLFWLTQSRCFYRPRANLNLPCCTVGGTGFMFALSVLGKSGWHTRSTCEDIEFTLNSIAEGHFVAFAPDAIFYDEQPLSFIQSVKQRYRWSLGGIQNIPLSTPRLVRALRTGKKRVFDALLYNIGVMIAGCAGLFWVLQMLLNAVADKSWRGLVSTLAIGSVAGYISIALFAGLILFLEKKTWPGVWKTILTFPFYLLSWSVINIFVLFYHNSTWLDIPHTENLSIDEIEKSTQQVP